VQAYAELERKLESRLPKLPDKAEPERIVAHKDALASAIQQTRSNAKQGDLFILEARPVLIKMIRSETVGAQGAQAREEIVDTAAKKGSNEAPAAVNLKVNSKYPSSVSLSTVPADLLTILPQLPSEVDYRFVHRHLILRSVKANLILDFIPGALPPPAKRKQ
jgi:ABC-type transporter Mla subunit MlaD